MEPSGVAATATEIRSKSPFQPSWPHGISGDRWAWAFLLNWQSITSPTSLPPLDLHSGIQGDRYPSFLLLQSPEKAELEAAGDLGHLQGVRRGGERKCHLKKVLGVQHQLG